MNDDRNILPQLPTGDELIVKEIEKYILSITEDYPEPHYLLDYQGVGFSPLGGIQAISGQKKNGKTFVLTQLMAVILNSESERVKAKLPGLAVNPETLEHIGHDPSVLYIDTEMEKLNTAKVVRRVHWLCNWELDQDYDRFHALWLRTVETPKEKINIIKKAIDIWHPTAIFIDGLRDLVSDFNAMDESMPLIINLMKTATENDCCIWSVLHMNPRQRNDDESKMRGHLGTELGNKVTDTLASYKSKSQAGVIFTVKQLDARGKDIPDWQFEIVDDAGGLGIPRIVNGTVSTSKPEHLKNLSDNETAEILSAVKAVIIPPTSLRYREILNGLKAQGIGTSKAQKWFSVACDLGIIDQPINGLYSLNTKIAEEIENELPF